MHVIHTHTHIYMYSAVAGDKMKFKQSVRQYEMDDLGRFADLRPTEERKYPPPPWVCPPARVKEIDSMISSGVLRVPSSWPPVRKLEHTLHMKTSECLLLAGDAGAYLLRLMSLQDAYTEKFIELLLLLKRYTNSDDHPELCMIEHICVCHPYFCMTCTNMYVHT